MTFAIDENKLQATVAALRARLLAAREPHGHWQGGLSGSALSTATAVFALALADRRKHSSLIDRGLHWLCANQNAGGGWGDTVQSPSNLSTTMLCRSALALPDGPPGCRHAVEQAELWLRRAVGTCEPQSLAKAVERQYGRDRTFSVPILTMCALAGRLGAGRQAWRLVRPLPFELAIFPHRLYMWLRLPVVSYALPALIAIGQARYRHLGPRNPLTAVVRGLSRAKSLRVLTRLQPENGGFLEAAPLTSFVVMSLAASGYRDHEVVSKGVAFLTTSIREDGSWPIDTNLATWVTTLSVNALSAGSLNDAPSSAEQQSRRVGSAHHPSPSSVGTGGQSPPYSAQERQALANWLLSCQHRSVHPYTQAAPGGWAWSNLPGAVPDADDTAGALLALHRLGSNCEITATAVLAGINWLLDLQNRDGGIPTFCRGWTRLPFDRSAPDITAHALAALARWLNVLPDFLKSRTEKAMLRAVQYLQDVQQADGSWIPLWFGNQAAPQQENPVYGTSRALTHLAAVGTCAPREAGHVKRDEETLHASRFTLHEMCERAARWLLSAQNPDGGWGGAASVESSIEETALAVDALATALLQSALRNVVTPDSDPGPPSAIESVCRGAEWLIRNTNQGRSTPASPIGLYFARLWYFEELYPVIFSLAALNKVHRLSISP